MYLIHSHRENKERRRYRADKIDESKDIKRSISNLSGSEVSRPLILVMMYIFNSP